MINAQRTGAYISSLRKGKDWTQQELAEKLLVTHQAVSQWEKGLSFPDIGLLPELAQVLGVTVDDLLAGQALTPRRASGAAMVGALTRGNPAEAARLVREDPGGAAAMLETAPLVRPSQLNEVVMNLSNFAFTLEQVKSLAPFVSQSALQALLERLDAAEIDGEALAGLAPFVGSETLERLVNGVGSGTLKLEQIMGLAPFLNQASLQTMVTSQLAEGQTLDPEHLKGLAPFLGRETLDGLLKQLPDGAVSIEFVLGMAPFAGQDRLEAMIGRVANAAEVGEHLQSLAPFISRERLVRLIVEQQGQLSAEDLVSLAPFIGREALDRLIGAGADANG